MSRALGLGTLRIFLILALVHLAVQYCYKLNILSHKTSDTPNYRLSMEVDSNDTIFSVTTVNKEVPMPMWHLKLIQRSINYNKMHYNGTIKTCEFRKFVKRVRVFREVSRMIVDSGNLSLDCPMLVGRYVLRNFQVLPDSAMLKFFYSPNSHYTLYGRVLSQLPNNHYERLCSYEINGTIVKSC